MATRAEKFRAQTQRANSKKNPKRKPQSAPPRATSSEERARATLVERHDGPAKRVPHNTALRVAKESAYELESVAKGRRASRMSTRKSPSHLKPDTAMRLRATDRAVSPESRTGRRARRRRIRAEEE